MSDKDPSDPRSQAAPKTFGRRRLEGVIPELLKRAVELGVEKATEAPDNLKELVGGMKVPKEIAHLIMSQVEETKNGLFRVVAKEMRDFLEHTNMAGEMQKMLTTLQFEISTTIRFKPNDAPSSGDGSSGDADAKPKMAKPEVKTDVHVKRDSSSSRSSSDRGQALNDSDDRPRERRRSRE